MLRKHEKLENQAFTGMGIVWDMIFTPFLHPNSPLEPLVCLQEEEKNICCRSSSDVVMWKTAVSFSK